MASDTWASTRVDERRLWDRHMEMAKIGATAKGGCNRAALTDLDIEARALFTGWARALGFTCAIDPAGNLFARREGRDPDAPPVVSGSHLDTQPSGGRFDGIFGVLAALEALEAIETAGIDTARPLEAAVWTNEEGVRFQPGCLGSLAFTYPDRHEAVLDTVDADGVTLRQAVARYRERVPDLGRYPPHRPIHAYVEAHIEQGPILERRGKTVGIVTGIQGSRRFEVEVHGEDAHSGTTPRAGRKDALSAAVAMIGALEEVLHDDPEDITRFTVGRFVVSPNALAVVPGYVMFTIDFRQPHDDVLVRLGDRVEGICEANAGACEVVVTETSHTPNVRFEGLVPETILAMAERLRVPHMHIFSGAGHDAKHIVDLCPTGMIFVPCEKGISHNEAENASPSDLAAGARVLADTLVKLANHETG